jgi:hypothetical protein
MNVWRSASAAFSFGGHRRLVGALELRLEDHRAG